MKNKIFSQVKPNVELRVMHRTLNGSSELQMTCILVTETICESFRLKFLLVSI